MNIRAAIAAGLLVFSAGGLAACGSSPSTPASATAIAKKLGCYGYQDVGPDAFTTDEAVCSTWSAGTNASIYIFKNQADEADWLGVLPQPGDGVPVQGPLWIVAVSNETQASKVVALLGGTAH
jgi:hypothetical protein